MRIRPFRLSDCTAVTQLLDDVLSETCYTVTMDAFANQLSLDSDLVLVAEEKEDIIGVIIGTIDNNNGYYYRVAVDRNHRRKGVGKRLVQSMRRLFEQRKVKNILVTVDEHTEPILFLYESLGYSSEDFTHSTHKLKIIAG